ncbi:MAG: hypothetical protein WBL49_06350 [Nitrososphaeraceae archaeon]|jgi:hypothetical protein
MGRSEENITRTEKFKITGIIAVAIFVVSMMVWSSFELQLQRVVAGTLENIQSFLSRISNTIATIYFAVLALLHIIIQ